MSTQDMLNRAALKQSSRRFTGATVTGFGDFDAGDHAARVHQHLKYQLLIAWRTDPTLRVDGSNASVADTIIDHLGDPAMQPAAVELARLLSDAANGGDVRLRALLLMSVVMEHHACYWEPALVEADHG